VIGENYLKIAATEEYVSSFNITWSGNSNDYANGITLDEEGNTYITGNTNNFGAGGSDAFLAKYT